MSAPPEVWPLDVTSPESVRAGLDDRADLWSGAEMVGVGTSARTVRELHVIVHGLVRLLVERFGFRSILVEGDREASEVLDTFVAEGTGDPRRTLADARPFLATQELLDLVLWFRHHNQQHPDHRVRMVHGGADDLSSPAALERSLAEQILSWRDRFDHKIIYLGGAAHTVAAERVAIPSQDTPVRPAGDLLRGRFGSGYRSVGLTFGAGTIPQAVPSPTPDSLEARLDELPHPTSLLAVDQHGDGTRWMAGVDRIRLVGPGYDPRNDPDHAMIGDLTAWFDAVVHQKVATSVTFLDD